VFSEERKRDQEKKYQRRKIKKKRKGSLPVLESVVMEKSRREKNFTEGRGGEE